MSDSASLLSTRLRVPSPQQAGVFAAHDHQHENKPTGSERHRRRRALALLVVFSMVNADMRGAAGDTLTGNITRLRSVPQDPFVWSWSPSSFLKPSMALPAKPGAHAITSSPDEAGPTLPDCACDSDGTGPGPRFLSRRLIGRASPEAGGAAVPRLGLHEKLYCLLDNRDKGDRRVSPRLSRAGVVPALSLRSPASAPGIRPLVPDLGLPLDIDAPAQVEPRAATFSPRGIARLAGNVLRAISGLVVGEAYAYTDTVDFETTQGYTVGNALHGQDAWDHYSTTANYANFRVRQETTNEMVRCNTGSASSTTYKRGFTAQTSGVRELRWRWRAKNTGGKLCIGPALDTTTEAADWADISARLCLDGGGAFNAKGANWVDRTGWPTFSVDTWYYNRANIDMDSKKFSWWMDTLADFSTESQLVNDSTLGGSPTTMYGVIIHANAGTDSVDVDDIWWRVPAAPPPPDNYASWSYDTTLYLNTTATGADVPGTVTNFPVLVRLNPGNFGGFANTNAGGSDIRFSKPDGTHLMYEIERWVDGGSNVDTAEIWVLVDTVHGNYGTPIKMLWGNGSAGDSSRGQLVFSSSNGFDAVWHLNESGTGTRYNAVSNSHHLTTSGFEGDEAVVGLIGGCDSLGAGTEHLTTSGALSISDGSTDSATWSVWIRSAGGTTFSDDWGKVFCQRNDANDAYIFTMQQNGGDSTHVNVNNAAVGDYYATPYDTWSHVVGSYDGDSLRLHVDGVHKESEYIGGPINASTQVVMLGRRPAGSQYYRGFLDEPRVSTVRRSDDWIRLCYENQKAGQVLTTYYDPGPPCPAGAKVWDGGGGDNLWSTPENWCNNSVPGASDSVVFDGTSNKNCTVDADVSIGPLNLASGYTGTLDLNDYKLECTQLLTAAGTLNCGTDTLWVQGSADFSGLSTLNEETGTVVIESYNEDITFTHGSETFNNLVLYVNKTASGNSYLTVGGGTLTVTGDLSKWRTSTAQRGYLKFDTNNPDVTIGGDLLHRNVGSVPQALYNCAGSGTWTVGGSVDFTEWSQGDGFQNATMVLNGSGTQTLSNYSSKLPAFSHTGSGTVQLSGATLSCPSLANSAGTIDFNSQDITTTGDFTITNGTPTTFANLAGRTITIGGTGYFWGTPGNNLNLNPGSSYTINATAGLQAGYADIANSQATGIGGLAYYSNNGGANSGWTFKSVATWDGGGADSLWSTAANWSGDVVPTPTDTILFASVSVKPCSLDIDDTIHTLMFTPAYTGEFDFGDRTLSLSYDLDCRSGGAVDPGTGALRFFAASGTQTLIPHPSATLPSIVKDGAGTVQVSTNALLCDSQDDRTVVSPRVRHIERGVRHRRVQRCFGGK